MTELIHLHSNRLNRNMNVLLLLIPTMIFVLVLALLLANRKTEQISTTYEPNVMGVESEK